jgi:hypothetical protein
MRLPINVSDIAFLAFIPRTLLFSRLGFLMSFSFENVHVCQRAVNFADEVSLTFDFCKSSWRLNSNGLHCAAGASAIAAQFVAAAEIHWS